MRMQRGLCGLGPVKIWPAGEEAKLPALSVSPLEKATAHLMGRSVIKNICIVAHLDTCEIFEGIFFPKTHHAPCLFRLCSSITKLEKTYMG